jgi:hypothetical protein
VGQVAREMHGMLTGPAADLEHLGAIGKPGAQHREDRFLVALAGIGHR